MFVFIVYYSKNNFRRFCVPRGTFCFRWVIIEKALLSNFFESKFKQLTTIDFE